MHARPDLIFMDIRLYGMDGLEATRQLEGDEERCRAADCDGYLAKPVNYKDLLATAASGAASV